MASISLTPRLAADDGLRPLPTASALQPSPLPFPAFPHEKTRGRSSEQFRRRAQIRHGRPIACSCANWSARPTTPSCVRRRLRTPDRARQAVVKGLDGTGIILHAVDLPPHSGRRPPIHLRLLVKIWRGWGWGWRKWTWTWRTTGRWTWRWRCSWRRQDGRRWLAPTATRTTTSAPSASTSRRTTPTSHTLRSVNRSHVRPAQLRGGCGRSWRWKSGEPGAPRDTRRPSVSLPLPRSPFLCHDLYL